MRIVLVSIVLFLAVNAGPAFADLHVISEVDTGPTGKIIVEQWLSNERSYRRQGQITYLANLKRKELLMIDHQQRQITHYDLIDPTPLGAFKFEISVTGQRGKVGRWAAEEFLVTQPSQPGIQYRVWTTRGIKAETRHYFNFVRRLPGGGPLAASLKQLEGFPVRIVSIISSAAGDQEIVSEVIKIENAEPPAGIYNAPKGYAVQ